jgi:hypothetical protein
MPSRAVPIGKFCVTASAVAGVASVCRTLATAHPCLQALTGAVLTFSRLRPNLRAALAGVALCVLMSAPMGAEVALGPPSTAPNTKPTRLWTRLIGTAALDDGMGIGTDRHGRVYLGAVTAGSFQQPNQGGVDAVALSLTTDGSDRWQDQWGSTLDDRVGDIAVTRSGESYCVGQYLPNPASPAPPRSFLRRFDRHGRACWQAELLGSFERVEVDGQGFCYVVGRGNSALKRISPGGSICWTRQIGERASASAVTTDTQSNAYVAGLIDGQATVTKYDRQGRRQWITQWDVDAESIRDLAVFADGRVVVVGNQMGVPRTPFIQLFSPAGAVGTGKTFDAKPYLAWRVAVGRDGSIYVGGSYDDDNEMFVDKFDPVLTTQWRYQLGGGVRGRITGLTIDCCGDILASGIVYGPLDGELSVGDTDIFVTKLRP